MKTKYAVLIDDPGGLNARKRETRRKNDGTFLSLPERPVGKNFRQVSWLGLSYSPRLPVPRFRSGQWLVLAAFVALTVAGPRRIRTGLPWRLKRKEKYIANRKLSRCFHGRPRNQSTKGTLTRQSTVEKKMIDAASSGWRP